MTALNSNAADVHFARALYLGAMGELNGAISEAQAARALDPVSHVEFTHLGSFQYFARSYDAEIQNERSSLHLEPNQARPHYWIAHCYDEKGDYQRAVEELKSVDRSRDEQGTLLLALGRSYAMAGDRKNALRIRSEFEELSRHQHVWPTDAAFFYAALGQNDRAFDWLEKAVQEKDGWLMFLNTDPRLDKLRADPRFAGVVSRVGLPPAK